MAVTFATISGQWVDPTGTPFSISYTKRLRVGYIEAATANGLLTSAGKVYFQRTFIDVDASGNASVTLPKVPQADISPSDPWYKMVVTKTGSRTVNQITLFFQITVDSTWDVVMASAVGNLDPGTSSLAEINDALANFEALASTVSRDGARRALAPWYSALVGRDSAAAKALIIGDSTSAGAGAGAWAKSMPYRLQAILRERHPVAGAPSPGAGYVPASAYLVDVTGTNSGGTFSTVAGSHGLGQQYLQIEGTDYFEYPAKFCDRIIVRYGKSNFLAAQGIVSIDGIDQVTLQSADAGTSDGYTWDSGALTPGWHTVRVRGVTGGFVFIFEGIDFYNGDYGKGIRVYNGAHSGFASPDYATGADLHWAVVAAIKPQLVVINLGINDWGARTPAAYLTNIDTILAKIATANSGILYSVVLVQPYRPSVLSPGTDADWLAIRDGLRVRAVGNVTLFDLDAGWPVLQADGATSAGLMFESTYPLHPSDKGHEYYAQQLAKLVGLADTAPAVLTTAPQSVVLAADVVNNNGTANTIATVTGLGFPVKAGKKYHFRFEIAYDAAATTTGSRWSITGPAGGTMRYRSEYSLTTTTRTLNDGLNAYDTPAASNASSAATGSNVAIVEGFIEPAASGTVSARFASEVLSSAITAKAGSVCYYHEVL